MKGNIWDGLFCMCLSFFWHVCESHPHIFEQLFVVQSLSHVQHFQIPWTVAYQPALSSAISLSLLKVMSIESVMPSNRLVLWHWLNFCLQSSASGTFLVNWLFISGSQSIGVLASASVHSIFKTDFRIDWFDLTAVHGSLKSGVSAF